MLAQRVSDFSGGMDDRTDRALIAANACPYLANCLVDRGRSCHRGGLYPLGGVSASPWGVGVYQDPGGLRRLLGVWGGRPYASQDGTSWDLVSASVSLVDSQHAFQVGRDSNARHLAVISSCGWSTDPSYAASALVFADLRAGACTQVSLMRPAVATGWLGRLWAGGLFHDSLPPDTLAWSKVWDFRDWSGVLSNNVRVDPGSGGRITGLLPARGTAPLLYILKERGIYIFEVAWQTDGWIPGTSDALNTAESQIRVLSSRVGCVAPATALWVASAEGSDVYFLAHDGIRSLRRTEDDAAIGGAGRPLTYRIPGIVSRVNWEAAHRSFAAAWGDYYFCAVPLDGAVRPNYVLVKHLATDDIYGGWTLWPLSLGGLAADSYLSSGFYFQGGELATEVTGASPGYGAFVYRYEPEAEDPRDPGGNGVTLTVITRSFDAGKPERLKYWRWADMYLSQTGTGGTLSIYASVDDDEESWTYLDTVSLEGQAAVLRLPARLPWQFTSERAYHVKCALDDLPASYRVALRLEASGVRLSLRQLDVAAQVLEKEWT